MSSSGTANGKGSINATTRMSKGKRPKVNGAAARLEYRTKSTAKLPKAGRLSQLMNMPMDVLMEIFGHLHPLDLLHVARTTKAFRRVLMHRSSLFVWKAALSTVPGLPDCPPELSEPEWANLAFDTHCTSCSRPNIRNVDWILRVRLCTACTKQYITKARLGGQSRGFADCASIVPTCNGKFLIDEYDKVIAQCPAIENHTARATFLAERVQLVKRIEKHAKLCVDWASAQALARSDELDRLKSSRHQAIVDKLVKLGWGEEIDKIPEGDALTTHKLVKVPQLLTDRIWENISKPMIQYMEDMKANRIARELEELRAQRHSDAVELLRTYKARCAPFTNVMPEPLDFCAFGPIKELLEQPPDINVDSESFSNLLPDVDIMVEEWRRRILKKLIQEVKVGVAKRSNILDDNPLDLDALDESTLQHMHLACIVFACIPCGHLQRYDDVFMVNDYVLMVYMGEPSNLPIMSRSPQTRPLWFPRVLAHRCLTKPRRRGFDCPRRLDSLPCYRQRWSCGSVTKVDQEACEAAKVITEACRMNPRTATVDEMDQLDARLECLACLEPNAPDPSHVVFGWRSAVKHQREYHSSHPGDWRLLTASEAEVARVEEENFTTTAVIPSDRQVWLCLHCLDRQDEQSWLPLEKVRFHVRARHDVEDPQGDRDYVKDFAVPELYATSTLFQATMVKFPQ